MKNKRKTILPIFLGVLSGILAFTVAASSSLAGKMIEVFYGVDIYLDDVLLDTKDANGNPVEAFIYNGTTYLPVRAVSEAVGKNVQWEGKTRSVYLGKHTGEKPAVWLKDMDYFTYNNGVFEDIGTAKDNTNVSHSNCILSTDYPTDCTYLLNGQYSKITGCFFLRYEYRSHSNQPTFKIYGDGELLYEAKVKAGVTPIDFSVDLTGVLELRVVLDFKGTLGDCGLWT